MDALEVLAYGASQCLSEMSFEMDNGRNGQGQGVLGLAVR